MATFKLVCDTLTLTDEHPNCPGEVVLCSKQLSTWDEVNVGKSLWIHRFHQPQDIMGGPGNHTYGSLIAEWGGKPSRKGKLAGRLAAVYCAQWPDGPQP